MAFLFTSNLIPGTSAAGFFAFKALLKSVGWTVTASSDGTAFSGNLDVITAGSGGSGGMANTRAWFAIRSPLLVGAFVVQRGATSDAWRITYSPGGLFADGGATTAPSAVDAVIVRGGGTEAAPTFEANLLGPTEGAIRLHMGAGDATAGAPFYLVGVTTGTNTIVSAFVRDVMLTPYSYAPDDTDPSVFYFGNKTANILAGDLANYGHAYALLGASVRGVVAEAIGTTLPGGCTASTQLSQRSSLVLWGRGNGQTSPRVKGWGSMLKWIGVAPAASGDLDASGRVQFGNVSMPWPVGLARPAS